MTLIGTSTDLIDDAVARKEGLPPFGIFDITPFGLVAAAAGAAVLIMFGPLLLPKGGAEALYGSQDEAEFLTELLVHGDSEDRKSGVKGQVVSVRVDMGGRRNIKKNRI